MNSKSVYGTIESGNFSRRINMRYRRQRIITVYLRCNGDFVPEETVGFLDISEGPQGEDIVKFTCPECKEEHESKRFAQ